MSKTSVKLLRWRFLDRLLSQGPPISQIAIMEAYQSNSDLRLIDPKEYERKNGPKQREALIRTYRPTLRKDLTIFRATLAQNGFPNMLVIERGAEEKLYEDGKDLRTKLFRYQDPHFSIIPYLASEMTDSEYSRLVKTIGKLKGILSEQTFEDIRFSVLSRVESDYGKGIQCVEYEDNRRLKGRQFRPTIYNAIKDRQILHIKYKTFKGVEYEYDFHPYLLKQYNDRWFAFGFHPDDGNHYFNVPLDRLMTDPVPVGHYEEPIPASYAQHFDSIVGVTRLEESVREHIVIKIHDIDSWGRAITKPLVSQQIENDFDTTAGFGIITLDVYPNDELYSKLLSWGKDIEVVSPANVRDEMKMIVDAIAHYYH